MNTSKKMNYKKIINIKLKTDLHKYKINEPLFYNNYLFHYLIIFDKLDILKMKKFPIYKENDDGLNGFFLAAKCNNLNILIYLITTYPQYIYNKNSNEEVFIDYLEYNYIMKILNYSLDWNILLINQIDNLMNNLNFNKLKLLFKKYKLKNYSLQPIVNNKNLNTDEIIKILNMFLDQINVRDVNDQTLIFDALQNKDLKLIEYLIEKKINIDYYTLFNTYHPLKTAFNINFVNAYELIWNNIKLKFDYTRTDRNLNNIAHFLLLNNFVNTVALDILINCPSDVWHQFNINKITPLELLIKYNFEKYNFLLKNKKVNLKLNDGNSEILFDKINNSKEINVINWITFLKLLPICENTNDIIIKTYDYSYYNLFSATFKDMSFYILHFKNKYTNLYLPQLPNLKLSNLVVSDEINISWPDPMLDSNPIFPWIICYVSKDEYWIHQELNNLINAQRRKKIYDFATCYISINNNGLLHANIIIYDFNMLTIERFDPYGDTVYFDKEIDDILEEELTWNTGFTYLKPSDYMPIAGFQSISDELNPFKQKIGDFGGYCLAWCSWYLEHRIINKNIKPNILINKLLKKLSYSNNTFLENIRNYANNLNKARTKYLKNIGIDHKIISNLYFPNYIENELTESIITTFTNL